jgi:hypothetical protein
LSWPEAQRLADREFVRALDRLAGTRNASACVEEPTLEEILAATSIVVENGKPGPLFTALGVSIPMQSIN